MKRKEAFLLVGAMFILTFGATAMAQPFLDCSEPTLIACDETQTNSTKPGEPGAGNVTVWCNNDALTYQDAREFVYEFTLEGPYLVAIWMSYTHISGVNDLDMSVRSICDERECLAYSAGVTGTEEMDIVLPAGTYYIGIDGYNGQQDGSSHTMVLNCEPVVSQEATTWSFLKALYR